MKIVVTGARGLLGRHAAARLHARNCAARFRKEPEPFSLALLGRQEFGDPKTLSDAIQDADVVLHFAGVNRGAETDVAEGNPAIAQSLADACGTTGRRPHIVYANSTHAGGTTVYGLSKSRAGEILTRVTDRYTDLVLPHIYGEGARPDYNNVTATFIDRVVRGIDPAVTPGGKVDLLHAGAAAQIAIDAGLDGLCGLVVPPGRPTTLEDLLVRLQRFHAEYSANLFPSLSDPFDLTLFNTYRTALYPDGFPRPVKLNTDVRGTLFEASRGGGGGQTFLSWTHPGVTRGDHFHLNKVERFLVLEGEAMIRIRRVLDDTVWSFPVTGETPAAVDMPTLHTHSIENTGARPLLTLFWTNEIFDPAVPDTYADPVLKSPA